MPIIGNKSVQKDQRLYSGGIRFYRAADHHSRVAVPYKYNSVFHRRQLLGNVLDVLMQRDTRSQVGLVGAKATQKRGDYFMPMPLQQRNQQVPRATGLPCAVYKNKG